MPDEHDIFIQFAPHSETILSDIGDVDEPPTYGQRMMVLIQVFHTPHSLDSATRRRFSYGERILERHKM